MPVATHEHKHTARDLDTIKESVRDRSTTELTCTDVSFKRLGWGSIFDGLSSSAVTRVSLNKCSFLAMDSSAVAWLLGEADYLQSLAVASSGLDDDFILALAQTQILSPSSKCKNLSFPDNHITDIGVQHLCRHLQRAERLSSLNLAYNCITDVSMPILTRAVQDSTALTQLNLLGNGIGASGLTDLAAVAADGHLTVLNISYNHLKDARLSLWVPLFCSAAFERLFVARTEDDSTEADAAAMLRAASSSPSLHTLDIRGVRLDGDAVLAACDLVVQSPSLQKLFTTVMSRTAADLLISTKEHMRPGLNLHVHIMTSPGPGRLLGQGNSHGCDGMSRSSSMCGLSHSGGHDAHGSEGSLVMSASTMSTQPETITINTEVSTEGSKQSLEIVTESPSEELGAFGPARLQHETRSVAAVKHSLLRGLGGGGTAHRAATAFASADPDGHGAASQHALAHALLRQGLLGSVDVKEVVAALNKEAKLLRACCANTRLSFSEFLACYHRFECNITQRQRKQRIHQTLPAPPQHWAHDACLQRIFTAASKIGTRAHVHPSAGLRGPKSAGDVRVLAHQWNRLCAESLLVRPRGPLAQFIVDLVFTKCRGQGGRGSRGLDFDSFLQAVACVAKEARESCESVRGRLEVAAARLVVGSGIDAGNGTPEVCSVRTLRKASSSRARHENGHFRRLSVSMQDREPGSKPHVINSEAISCTLSDAFNVSSTFELGDAFAASDSEADSRRHSISTPSQAVHDVAATKRLLGSKKGSRAPLWQGRRQLRTVTSQVTTRRESIGSNA